jgi:hypothetical protein
MQIHHPPLAKGFIKRSQFKYARKGVVFPGDYAEVAQHSYVTTR